MIEKHDCNLDLIFYLRSKPETCLNRVYQRGRPEEKNSISFEYLKKLHDFHEEWLIEENEQFENSPKKSRTKFYKPPTVIVIDADQSLNDVYKTIETETRSFLSIKN